MLDLSFFHYWIPSTAGNYDTIQGLVISTIIIQIVLGQFYCITFGSKKPLPKEWFLRLGLRATLLYWLGSLLYLASLDPPAFLISLLVGAYIQPYNFIKRLNEPVFSSKK
jgi:hypothetical protein